MPVSTANGQHSTVDVAFSCPQHTLSTQACEVGGFSLLSKMSKREPREVRGLARGHKAGRWQGWNMSPGLSDAKPLVLRRSVVNSVPGDTFVGLFLISCEEAALNPCPAGPVAQRLLSSVSFKRLTIPHGSAVLEFRIRVSLSWP